MADAIPDEEKARRLHVPAGEPARDSEASNYQRHMGQVLEVMVEGKNEARGQWVGRTSQNKIMNFTAPRRMLPGDRQLRSGAGSRRVFPTAWWEKWWYKGDEVTMGGSRWKSK